MGSYPLRERRERATREFWLRVTMVVALMAAIAWIGWFAPWAKAARSDQKRTAVPIEITH